MFLVSLFTIATFAARAAGSGGLKPPLSYVEITGAIGGLQLDGGFLEIEAGDVNGDGCPDLVSVGDHGSPFINTQQHGVTVWLGDRASGWTLVQTGNFGYGGCTLGDANGDGKLDIGYGIHHDYSSSDLGDQILEVALGDGSGASWTAWDDGLATNGEDYGMFGADFGDVDADGDLDLGSTSFGCCSGVHVYRNHGDGTWSQCFGFLGGNSDSRFEFADFDGDGHLDVCAGHATETVWLGDGLGGFSPGDGNLPGSHYIGASAGDVDADGRDELAFVAGGQARVWAWGQGNSWSNKSANLSSVSIPNVQELALADMDADGRAELLVFGKGRLGVYTFTTHATWQHRWDGTSSGRGDKDGELIRGGTDLDHNGLPDLWFVQREPRGFLGDANVHRVLAEASAPATLTIRPLAPEPRRVWRSGQARFVEWTSAVPSGVDLGTVDVYLSANGGAAPFLTLASDLPHNGRAQIVVPPGIDSTNCRVIYLLETQALGRRMATGPSFTIAQ